MREKGRAALPALLLPAGPPPRSRPSYGRSRAFPFPASTHSLPLLLSTVPRVHLPRVLPGRYSCALSCEEDRKRWPISLLLMPIAAAALSPVTPAAAAPPPPPFPLFPCALAALPGSAWVGPASSLAATLVAPLRLPPPRLPSTASSSIGRGDRTRARHTTPQTHQPARCPRAQHLLRCARTGAPATPILPCAPSFSLSLAPQRGGRRSFRGALLPVPFPPSPPSTLLSPRTTPSAVFLAPKGEARFCRFPAGRRGAAIRGGPLLCVLPQSTRFWVSPTQ
jgi:hypothetical protein